MAATKEEIREWLNEGIKKGATHVIVVCDTWDWEDYPVYVMPEEDVRNKERSYMGGDTKIMEIYNLKMSLEVQLNQVKAFNY